MWRWWDGTSWTASVHGAVEKKPRLPNWLSIPVVMCSVPTVLFLLYLAFVAPVAIFLAGVPLLLVAPVLVWLDRVEPEPLAARLHAILWGATVAVTLAFVINTGVAFVAGEKLAAVVSAPVVEEAGKGLGILWAVRRKEVDGIMDGAVYAGWVALGFAMVEDVLYFAEAASSGLLVWVFIVRAVLTPFAHPLFTVWTGIAIGRSISKGGKAFPSVLWGYGLAVGLHAAWNGTITYGGTLDEVESVLVVLSVVLLFIALLVGVGIALVKLRSLEKRRFVEHLPMLAARYGLTPGEVAVFGNFRSMLQIRSSLSKVQKKHFDGVHTALARLALLYSQPQPADPTTEQRLAIQLDQARRAPS